MHTSTREVLAVYSIDEARMELVITLAVNYPLGSVKVESGKQIGGRLSSQNIRMQLTIFLTHQVSVHTKKKCIAKPLTLNQQSFL